MKLLFHFTLITAMLFTSGCKTTSHSKKWTIKHDKYNVMEPIFEGNFIAGLKRNPIVTVCPLPGIIIGGAAGACLAIVTLPIGILITYGIDSNLKWYERIGLPIIFDSLVLGAIGGYITGSPPWAVFGWHIEQDETINKNNSPDNFIEPTISKKEQTK